MVCNPVGWSSLWTKNDEWTFEITRMVLRRKQSWKFHAQRVHPNYHNSRRVETNRMMNPVPYIANYFGHKLHIDQNEKMVMFGVTHILAVDGFSGKIVSLVSVPVKNCALIYEHVYM